MSPAVYTKCVHDVTGMAIEQTRSWLCSKLAYNIEHIHHTYVPLSFSSDYASLKWTWTPPKNSGAERLPRCTKNVLSFFSCDIVSFNGVVLVSFVAQVRSIMFYDLELTVGRLLSSLGGQTTLVMPTTYFDMTFVQGPYCLGHANASMPACLSPMIRDLRGSQPRNSLLHFDYAIHLYVGLVDLIHVRAHTLMK